VVAGFVEDKGKVFFALNFFTTGPTEHLLLSSELSTAANKFPNCFERSANVSQISLNKNKTVIQILKRHNKRKPVIIFFIVARRRYKHYT
jgi:hypothetical protein